MRDGPNNSQCLFLVGWIVGHNFVIASWSICGNILSSYIIFLNEDRFQTQCTPICVELESFCNVRTSKHWGRIQPWLQCLKGMTLVAAPNPILVFASVHGELTSLNAYMNPKMSLKTSIGPSKVELHTKQFSKIWTNKRKCLVQALRSIRYSKLM